MEHFGIITALSYQTLTKLQKLDDVIGYSVCAHLDWSITKMVLETSLLQPGSHINKSYPALDVLLSADGF